MFFALLAFGIVWLLWLRRAAARPRRARISSSSLPVLSFVLLHGAPRSGLASSTALWGGMLVTMVVATVGIVFSLPLGILLALGRRSTLPAVGCCR